MRFTFDGQTKNYLSILVNEARWMTAQLERSSVKIPGAHGAIPGKVTLQPRVLSIPVMIEHDGLEDLQAKKLEMAAWLVTQDAKELLFPDEPTIVYRAALTNPLSNIVESQTFTTGVLEFTCYDPFRYERQWRFAPVGVNNAHLGYVGSASTSGWIATINFPVATTNFTITNATTGQHIRINWQFAAHDTLVIDASRRKIMINGEARMGSFAFEISKWFEIDSSTILRATHNTTMSFINRWY